MIGRGAILAVTALGVGATALPQIDDRPPRLVWTPAPACRSVSTPSTGSSLFTPAIWLSETARSPCPFPCRPRLSAARRAVAETRGGSRRTNNLPHRPQRHCRRNRNRRGPRARQPRPLASCLAGLPRHRNRRRLPDEPAVRQLARRTLFRPAARRLDRRARDPSLDPSNRRGGVIVPPTRKSAAVTQGDNSGGHSVISAGFPPRFRRPSRPVGQSRPFCYRPRATRVRQRGRRSSTR